MRPLRDPTISEKDFQHLCLALISAARESDARRLGIPKCAMAMRILDEAHRGERDPEVLKNVALGSKVVIQMQDPRLWAAIRRRSP